jgi:hypothetical protein
MQFLMMVSGKENQGQPPAAMMEAIEQAAEEATKNGTMVFRGGLYPASQAVRMRVNGGRLIVTDGPFAEAKEVVGGFAIFELKTREEALEGAKHFMELHQRHWPGWVGEIEVRQVWQDAPDLSQSAK